MTEVCYFCGQAKDDDGSMWCEVASSHSHWFIPAEGQQEGGSDENG